MANRRTPVSKRLLDLVVSTTALVLLAPVFGLVALMVALYMGRPVFFVQLRPGLNGRLFPLFKFRSLTEACHPDGTLLPAHDRITTFGRLLRSSSLDELPELINVLRGEMSLVGPRPLLAHYLLLYSTEQARRHEVLPGLTGWAQIHGRNGLAWGRRLALDVWYVDHWSLWLDLRILVQTIAIVVMRDGIDEPGTIGIAEFTGNAVDASAVQPPLSTDC